jgi:hypothetical protein
MTTDERAHRLAMGTFLSTFSHYGIFGPVREGGACPLPFTLSSVYTLDWSYVAPSTHSQAKLARACYLHSLWSPVYKG